MIKVVFFDVDGTLLSHKTNSIPQSTIDALNKLKEQKVMRVICSGRHYKELEEIQLEYMDFDAWILLNGQIVLNGNKDVIIDYPLDMKSIMDIFNKKEIPLQILEKDDYYINFENEEVRIAQKAIHTPVPQVKEYSGNAIYQVIAFTDKNLDEFSGLKQTRWNSYGVDIVSPDGGKGSAIRRFCEYYGISKSETMAFGDGDNDVDMFENVGVSIAMGNAVEHLKKISTYVTDDIDHDGILNALKFYKILK